MQRSRFLPRHGSCILSGFTVTTSGLSQQGGKRGHPLTEGQGLNVASITAIHVLMATAAREAGTCCPAAWPPAMEEEEDGLGRRPADLHLPSLYEESLCLGQIGF